MAYRTGAGPAVVPFAHLPDRHAFRGSFGGYAFRLWDRRQGPQAHNLNAALLAGLSLAYALPIEASMAFDAIAALLSASSYTRRFAADLEASFPRIPFPAEGAVFQRAARIGAEIRAVAGFARPPAARFSTVRLGGRDDASPLAARPYNATAQTLPLTETQAGLCLLGVAPRVMEFQVSGYAVLRKWIEARAGEPLDAAMQSALLDLLGRLTEYLALQDEAETVLQAALELPLTRVALGLSNAGEAPPEPLDVSDHED
jgi:hypothetical protein